MHLTVEEALDLYFSIPYNENKPCDREEDDDTDEPLSIITRSNGDATHNDRIRLQCKTLPPWTTPERIEWKMKAFRGDRTRIQCAR